MLTAQPVNALPIIEAQTLPNGVKVLLVPCIDYDALRALPAAVAFEGVKFGRTGWNSDSHVAYYRNDALIALVL